MKRFNLAVQEKEFEELEAIADEKGVTVTEVIRQAIRLRIRVESEQAYLKDQEGLYKIVII